MKRISSFSISSIFFITFFANTTHAANTLPASVLPEQAGRAIQQQNASEQTMQPLPQVLEPAKAKKGQIVGEQAQKIKFKLNGITLKGNHVYSEKVLAKLYEDKIGKTITVAELFQIIQNITNYYRNNGYVLSRAILPPQHVQNGFVTIEVIEGYIDKVSVAGHPGAAMCYIQAIGDKIKQSRPLEISAMEKYLYIANETPGTSLKAVVGASKKQSRAADLTLVTENKPISASLSYDNYGTRYIGPQEMGAHVNLNSFLTSGDSVGVSLTKTPKGKELTYFDMNYSLPLNVEGVRWSFGGTRVVTNPGFVLTPIQINGVNKNYYTTVTYPVIRNRETQLTLRTGFNYLDSYVTAFSEQLYTDHIRSLDFGGTYQHADKWFGVSTINVDLRKGLPTLGYSSDTNIFTALTSRPGGHANYTKVTVSADRQQAVVGGLSLYGIVQGQYAPDALLSAEQFTFGGSQIGRGYDAAELIGDQGTAASVEARYNMGFDRRMLQTVQFYTFYDVGVVWNKFVIGGVPIKSSATSAGFGARFVLTNWLTGNVMWAQPLTKQVAAEALVQQGKSPRVFFSLNASV